MGIKAQGITYGHKTFGVKWSFEHLATHQHSATVDTNAARSLKHFIRKTVMRNMTASELIGVDKQ